MSKQIARLSMEYRPYVNKSLLDEGWRGNMKIFIKRKSKYNELYVWDISIISKMLLGLERRIRKLSKIYQLSFIIVKRIFGHLIWLYLTGSPVVLRDHSDGEIAPMRLMLRCGH